MDATIISKCYEPLEIRTRKGPKNQMYSYVSSKDVIHRMNTVFSGNWSSEVLFQDIVEDQVIIRVRVVITDPETGQVYHHEGFGSQHIARYNSGPNQDKSIDIGNAYKSALSKAIVNACRMWGVGLFFDEQGAEEDGESAVTVMAAPSMPVQTLQPPVQTQANTPIQSAPQAGQQIPVTPTVSQPMAVPANVSPIPKAAPVVASPMQASVQAPVNNYSPVKEAVMSAPVSTTKQSMVLPSAASLPDLDIPKLGGAKILPRPTVQAEGTVVQSAPELPAAAPSKVEDLPFSSTQMDAQKISDVQKVAINGILSLRKMTYDQLATEAFASIGLPDYKYPPLEQLTYNDAVVLIKYGNNKFRK